MSTFIMPIYESDIGPYIIDVKAEHGNDAIKLFIEEIRSIYNIEQTFNSLEELEEYITNDYKGGVLILGEIYNIESFK